MAMTYSICVFALLCYYAVLPTSAIFHGIRAKMEDFPYQISIGINGKHVCGGFILGHEWVATAAQCFNESITPSNLTIQAGVVDIYNHRFEYEYFVSEIIQHPNFNNETFDNDIALIKLEVTDEKESFNFDVTTIQKIPIPEENMETKVGARVKIAGWGQSENQKEPNLMYATLSVVSPAQCGQQLARFGGITDNMICAMDPSFSGRDACRNDAGGALVHNGEAIGIISWGAGCGQDQYPGVYTKISSASVRSFIKAHVGILT